MEKIDSTIRICGHDIKIEEKEEKFMYHNLGESCLSDCQIFIRQGMSDDAKISTTFHEILHIIDRINDLKLGEEYIFSVIASSFLAMFKDNSEFFKQLLFSKEKSKSNMNEYAKTL